MQLEGLVADCFEILQSYLELDDYHFLLNTSKHLFSGLKKKTLIFSLSSTKSKDYVNDANFAQLLLSKLENGWKQVYLTFVDNIPEIPPDLPFYQLRTIGFGVQSSQLESLCHIQSLKGIKEIRFLPPIPKVKELTIYQGFVLKRLSNLSHLRSLTMYGVKQSDITPLASIPSLHLYNCPCVSDFSTLSYHRQTHLTLFSCPGLQSVESFRGIHQLTLESCESLVDVSPLHGIYSLCLRRCSKVQDISGLGSHNSLAIEFCSFDMTGYDCFLNVPYVSLIHSSIKDTSVFQFSKRVQLLECPNIIDLLPLQHVRSVMIQPGVNVLNLTPISKVKSIFVDFSKWQGGFNLPIFENNSVCVMNLDPVAIVPNMSLHCFSSVSLLNITKCDRIVQLVIENGVQTLSALEELIIQGSDVLLNANGLGFIPTVKLILCRNLSDISGLGKGNRSVEISHCPLVKDVSSLANVPIVTIRNYRNIENWSCLSKNPRLKLLPR